MSRKGTDPVKEAEPFIDPEKGVESVEDALAGARDIIAEIINEDDKARARLRNLFFTKAVIKSRVASGHGGKGSEVQRLF